MNSSPKLWRDDPGPDRDEYSLQLQGRKLLYNTFPEEIEEALLNLDAENSCFCVLSHKDGSYVQTVGSPTGLTVEFRKIEGRSFQHFVLGKSAEESEMVSLGCKVGPIKLQKNEILEAADALKIFAEFWNSRSVPADYFLRDITAEFKTSGG